MTARSLAALVLAAGLAGRDAGSGAGEDARANPRDASNVALGAKVYARNCAACHGVKLEGRPDWRKRLVNGRLPAPPHDDSGHTWHHPDELLFAITKDGLVPPFAPRDYQSDMPAFGGVLSDEEIWAVLAYIKGQWSAQVRQIRAEMLAGARRR